MYSVVHCHFFPLFPTVCHSLNMAAVYITAAAPTRVALAEDKVIRLETVTQAILDVEF